MENEKTLIELAFFVLHKAPFSYATSYIFVVNCYISINFCSTEGAVNAARDQSFYNNLNLEFSLVIENVFAL